MPTMASHRFPILSTFAFLAAFSACTGKPQTESLAEVMPASAASAASAAMAATGASALQSTTLKPGAGAAIAGGQIAVVQYTGWLYETGAKDHKGKEFDSSIPRREAFKFPLGTGSVIKGWDQGVLGMKVGETRRLVIPPELAYGDNGAAGVIPPGATLVFDVELVGVE